MPIVVVTSDARYVVVDGHKRVRCLHRLHRDTVTAVIWDMATGDALIFRHLLQTDAPENVFEQAWLLRALHEEHGLALDIVARLERIVRKHGFEPALVGGIFVLQGRLAGRPMTCRKRLRRPTERSLQFRVRAEWIPDPPEEIPCSSL